MRTKINLKSGSILELEYTDCKTAMKLLRSLTTCIQKQVKDFKIDSTLLKTELNVIFSQLSDKIIPIITEIIINEDLEPILYECANNCLLNDLRIVSSTFEDINARRDFFETMFNIAKYNISVFFPKAVMK